MFIKKEKKSIARLVRKKITACNYQKKWETNKAKKMQNKRKKNAVQKKNAKNQGKKRTV